MRGGRGGLYFKRLWEDPHSWEGGEEALLEVNHLRNLLPFSDTGEGRSAALLAHRCNAVLGKKYGRTRGASCSPHQKGLGLGRHGQSEATPPQLVEAGAVIYSAVLMKFRHRFGWQRRNQAPCLDALNSDSQVSRSRRILHFVQKVVSGSLPQY